MKTDSVVALDVVRRQHDRDLATQRMAACGPLPKKPVDGTSPAIAQLEAVPLTPAFPSA